MPEPSLLDGLLDRVISQAGHAIGVIDAMMHIMVGVLQMDPNGCETRVGLRRRRPDRQQAARPGGRFANLDGRVPNVAVMTAVVALDYLRTRFKDASWVEPTPRLDALRAKVAERPAYAKTEPYV